jgi:PAS domain S-box-containing protein
LLRDEVALEQKNAQLEASQQFIYGLLSSMSDVLVAADAQGLIEQTNQALCELAGRSEDALLGAPMQSLLHPSQDGAALQNMMHRALMLRQGHSVELMLSDAAGQPVPVDFTATPRYDSRRRCIGYVFVGRPTAEIQRAYRQLHEAHEALKRTQQQLLHSEKMASLGRLVAGVAHELNNPISFVLGNVHALNRYTTAPAPVPGGRAAAALGDQELPELALARQTAHRAHPAGRPAFADGRHHRRRAAHGQHRRWAQALFGARRRGARDRGPGCGDRARHPLGARRA